MKVREKFVYFTARCVIDVETYKALKRRGLSDQAIRLSAAAAAESELDWIADSQRETEQSEKKKNGDAA